MIFSMTGFGRAIGQVKMLTLTVEIRTVNGKSLEYSNRLPAQYNDKEQEIRKRIADKLERGSIQLTIQRTDPSGNNFTINTQVLENYLQSLKPLAEKYQQDASVLLSQLIRLPEVLQNNQQQLDEEESVCLFETLDEALNQVLLFRKQEGLALQKTVAQDCRQTNRQSHLREGRPEPNVEGVANGCVEAVVLEKVDEVIKPNERLSVKRKAAGTS
jgi:uncharacterized protein (TIGR00255 family)